MRHLLPLALLCTAAYSQTALDIARAARDSADAAALRARIAEARKETSLPALLLTAQLDAWLCEALYSVNDAAGVKRAAQAGLDAAERAVRIAPESSEAHRLLGALLGQLIPHVFAGGMRYGARAAKELERALELDPRNVEAHIARAQGYLFAPAAFGGDKQKALQHLARALELDPQSDSAHLWRAQAYAEMKEKEKARAEIEAALRLNPKRAYTASIERQLRSR
jgi:tetratricopeptide (TPR) repeat protein